MYLPGNDPRKACGYYCPDTSNSYGQEIKFDDCCVNTNACCGRFPIIWPPHPKIPPRIICRDCGCAYLMQDSDCFPLPTPDFSQLLKHGYQLEISQPNACNEIYFNFSTCRCIPPLNLCCRCPLCRKKRRTGDHFRDCTCQLCERQRKNCLNRVRREMLTEQRKQFCSSGYGAKRIPPCCLPQPTPNICGKEEKVPRGPHIRCPCHLFPPTNWELIEPCPEQLKFAKIILNEEKEASEKANKMKKNQRRILSFITVSMSQQVWNDGSPLSTSNDETTTITKDESCPVDEKCPEEPDPCSTNDEPSKVPTDSENDKEKNTEASEVETDDEDDDDKVRSESASSDEDEVDDKEVDDTKKMRIKSKTR